MVAVLNYSLNCSSLFAKNWVALEFVQKQIYVSCIVNHSFSKFFLFLAQRCSVLAYSEKICWFLHAALALAFKKTNANLTVQRVVEQKAGFFFPFCRNRDGVFRFLVLELNYFIKTWLMHHKGLPNILNENEKKINYESVCARNSKHI